MTDFDRIRQAILDEAGGNMSVAFEGCLDLLLLERAYSEKRDAEIAAWRKGASLAFLRVQASAVASGKVDDVPDDTLHDHWLKTATA